MTRTSAASTLAAALDSDRLRALALTPVSRETLARLDRFVELLLAWQRTTNLIAPSTLPTIWTRHVADSIQLIELAPQARTWIDLGSGAGFPGLVIACALANTSESIVHLVDSNAKKVAFLREAQRVTESPVVVHLTRIEDFAAQFAGPVDGVTARAVAPLNTLLEQSFPLLRGGGAVAVFPKGKNVEAELGEARRSWNINVNIVPSRTDPNGRIVVVRQLAPSGTRL